MSNLFSWYSIRVPAQQLFSTVDLIKTNLKSLSSNDIVSKSLKEISIISFNESTKKNGKLIKKEKSVYPGYFFVLCDEKNLPHIINFIKKALHISFINILGGEKSPSKISQLDYDKMLSKRTQLTEGNVSVASQDLIEMGSMVQMISGNFESFVGKIISIDSENKTAVIDIVLLGQATTITAKFNEFKIS